MATLIQNLNTINSIKGQIKEVIGTQSEVFSEYPSLIQDAIEAGGGSGAAVLGDITITANGLYAAGTYSYDGFENVTVNVPTSVQNTAQKIAAWQAKWGPALKIAAQQIYQNRSGLPAPAIVNDSDWTIANGLNGTASLSDMLAMYLLWQKIVVDTSIEPWDTIISQMGLSVGNDDKYYIPFDATNACIIKKEYLREAGGTAGIIIHNDTYPYGQTTNSDPRRTIYKIYAPAFTGSGFEFVELFQNSVLYYDFDVDRIIQDIDNAVGEGTVQIVAGLYALTKAQWESYFTKWRLDGTEIPEGTYSITANGTFDVSTYASAVVNVSGGGSEGYPTYYFNDTGISEPYYWNNPVYKNYNEGLPYFEDRGIKINAISSYSFGTYWFPGDGSYGVKINPVLTGDERTYLLTYVNGIQHFDYVTNYRTNTAGLDNLVDIHDINSACSYTATDPETGNENVYTYQEAWYKGELDFRNVTAFSAAVPDKGVYGSYSMQYMHQVMENEYNSEGSQLQIMIPRRQVMVPLVDAVNSSFGFTYNNEVLMPWSYSMSYINDLSGKKIKGLFTMNAPGNFTLEDVVSVLASNPISYIRYCTNENDYNNGQATWNYITPEDKVSINGVNYFPVSNEIENTTSDVVNNSSNFLWTKIQCLKADAVVINEETGEVDYDNSTWSDLNFVTTPHILLKETTDPEIGEIEYSTFDNTNDIYTRASSASWMNFYCRPQIAEDANDDGVYETVHNIDLEGTFNIGVNIYIPDFGYNDTDNILIRAKLDNFTPYEYPKIKYNTYFGEELNHTSWGEVIGSDPETGEDIIGNVVVADSVYASHSGAVTWLPEMQLTTLRGGSTINVVAQKIIVDYDAFDANNQYIYSNTLNIVDRSTLEPIDTSNLNPLYYYDGNLANYAALPIEFITSSGEHTYSGNIKIEATIDSAAMKVVSIKITLLDM